MYILSRLGAYSVIRKRHQYVFRSRSREDLEQLAALAKLPLLIRATPKRDYAYRVKVCREVAEDLAKALILDVDYDDFKSVVHDTDKEVPYLCTWLALKMGDEDYI